jgi:hypothetical protein
VVCALVVGGCGSATAPGQDRAAATVTTPPRVDVPETTTAPGTVEPVGTPGVGTVHEGGFPSAAGETAHLVDVRAARHHGFDRVVLEFRGDQVPGYRVGYVAPPVREDGTGSVMAVAGEEFLELRLTPASAFDLGAATPAPTYTGPDRIEPPDTGAIAELVMTGDFEANLAWTIGLDRRAPFAVTVFRAPLRLVVDVMHG